MHILTCILFRCYTHIQRISDVGLFHNIYNAACTFAYLRLGCVPRKGKVVPAAISKFAKGKIAKFKNLFNLDMEKHIPRSSNNAANLLAVLKIIHLNCYNYLHSIDSF